MYLYICGHEKKKPAEIFKPKNFETLAIKKQTYDGKYKTWETNKKKMKNQIKKNE